VDAAAITPSSAGAAAPPGLKGSAPPPPNSLPAGNASAASAPQHAAVFGRGGISAGDLFRQTAAALNLPADPLNIAILAISRFFSLTPSHASMTALRREVLASSTNSSPQTAAEKAALEAKALAAAAAFDKGVALTPEALERYARFFAAPASAEDPGKPADKPADKQPEDPREASGENAASGGGGFGGSGGKNSQDREELPQKDDLRIMAEEEAAQDDLLDLLNSIPGKNGQYWVVFPFNITVRGTELKVFIRILKGKDFLPGGSEYLIVDIAGSKRQYRCFLKKNSGKIRADIEVYPGLPPKALRALAKKAENFLPFEEVLARNGEGAPSWAENWCAESLPAVNEEA